MKKFTMTKTQYRALLPAIRKLIRHYEGKSEGSGLLNCPLCDVSRHLSIASGIDRGGCRFCPWRLFTKMYCEVYVKKYYMRNDFGTVASRLRVDREPRWTRNRIRTLKRWEMRIKAIIEELRARDA